MRKLGIFRIPKWRPSASLACFGVVVFCGLLIACLLVVFLEGQVTRELATETRIKVNAELRACTLNDSDLPTGWKRDWPTAFPLYSQPVPPGMLGGILTEFPHQGASARYSAAHELQFYDRTFRAIYAYRIRRVFSDLRWQDTWKPLDLTQVSLSANEYRASCGNFAPGAGASGEEKTCQAQSRYGRFVSVFSANISRRNMSETEFIFFLQAIDRHMLQCAESLVDKEWAEW